MVIEMKKLINDLAQDVIKAYQIDVPVMDIDSVVGLLGGKIIDTVNLPSEMEGSVQKESNGDGFIIYVSSIQNAAQRRFTVAHELGHLFLHMGYKTNPSLWNAIESKQFFRSQAKSEWEYQANEFAAAFLMPKPVFTEILNRFTSGDKVDTAKVAEYFGVSVSAASYRGKFLGLLKW